MQYNNKKILKILKKGNYLSEEDIKKTKKSLEISGISIVDHLLNKSLITKDLLGQAIAETFEMNYADINSNPPTKETVLRIPEKIARKHRTIIFKESKDEVILATDNPIKAGEFFKELEEIFQNKKISFAFGLTDDIEDAFIHYRKPLKVRFDKIIDKNPKAAPEIIDEIFEEALIRKASDIHFEPFEKNVIVRFRIDGVLQKVTDVKKLLYENILNRIKVMAHLRVDDHFSAQDGAIRHAIKNKDIDLRISIAPTLEGEKITVRILAKYIKGFALSDLGLNVEAEEKVEKSSKKPFGMILVSGPTGSGKTTTLYALLKKLHQPEVNITTIEDPAEYRITGINQIQVNKETNLTFAKGLRSIVRQDPDIILVGEIRDEETAEISVNAALTGHLLLSTFHANDAATSIPRLLDMGVEPFLLSSTLEMIIAQRLIRKICDICRTSYSPIPKKLDKKFPNWNKFLSKDNLTLYKGKGCESCNHTGYKGRTAIFEIIQVTPELRELILENPSSQEISSKARKQGSKTLFEDGLDKVKKGITTIDELLRVAPPPDINEN